MPRETAHLFPYLDALRARGNNCVSDGFQPKDGDWECEMSDPLDMDLLIEMIADDPHPGEIDAQHDRLVCLHCRTGINGPGARRTGNWEPSWPVTVYNLRRRDRVRAAQANAELLSQARRQWEGRVVARSSMHDLLFTEPGDLYPFSGFVSVSWQDDVFELKLFNEKGLVVTADRCRGANAPVLLDAFLAQLAGEADDPSAD